MVFSCNFRTDLDELIGTEREEGSKPFFRYGPLVIAMRQGEELILENSGTLSPVLRQKIKSVLRNLFIGETGELINAKDGFRLSLR